MTVGADEFVRRFLQHVLPSRLQKVRHYGFLSPNARRSIESLQWLVSATFGLLYRLACFVEIVTPSQPALICHQCGQAMILMGYLLPWFTPWPRSRPP